MLAALVLRMACSEQPAPFSGGGCGAMRARLAWLHAETASLVAQLRDTCEPQTRDEMLPVGAADTLGSGVASLRALTVPASDGGASSGSGIRFYVPPRSKQPESSTITAAPAHGGRRRESDLPTIYSAQCYRAGSSFDDASCGCLGKPKSSQFDLRPTIKIVVGSWYVPPDVQSADAAFDTECACQASWNN